jgi:hypothetical protein
MSQPNSETIAERRGEEEREERERQVGTPLSDQWVRSVTTTTRRLSDGGSDRIGRPILTRRSDIPSASEAFVRSLGSRGRSVS